MSERRAKRNVEIRAADPSQAPLIQNLMQLYIHDFSEFWAGSARGDLDAEGRFAAYPLAPYWSRPHWFAGLMWCYAQLAGFGCINDETHSQLRANRNMAEF